MSGEPAVRFLMRFGIDVRLLQCIWKSVAGADNALDLSAAYRTFRVIALLKHDGDNPFNLQFIGPPTTTIRPTLQRHAMAIRCENCSVFRI